MAYITFVPVRAAGIPALAGLTGYSFQAPARCSAWRCDSDWDYYGYEEIEWDLLDQRGRKAPWLERKLTAKDLDNIQGQISAYMEKSRREGDL